MPCIAPDAPQRLGIAHLFDNFEAIECLFSKMATWRRDLEARRIK